MKQPELIILDDPYKKTTEEQCKAVKYWFLKLINEKILDEKILKGKEKNNACA